MSPRRVTRIASQVLIGLATILLITGAWLSFRYEPLSPNGLVARDAPLTTQVMHYAHSWSAYAFLAVAGVWLIDAVVSRMRRPVHSHRWGWAPPFGLVVFAAFGVVTGSLLAWDQVALWAVEVEQPVRGLVGPLLDDTVRFFLISNREIDKSEMAVQFLIHAVALAAVAGSMVATCRMRTRSADDSSLDNASRSAVRADLR